MELLSIRQLQDPATFALEGELDLSSADELLAVLGAVPPAGDVVLDLSGLSFMDSSGLRVLLQVAHVRDGGSCVVLRNPSSGVDRVLEIALPGESPGIRVERLDADGKASGDD